MESTEVPVTPIIIGVTDIVRNGTPCYRKPVYVRNSEIDKHVDISDNPNMLPFVRVTDKVCDEYYSLTEAAVVLLRKDRDAVVTAVHESVYRAIAAPSSGCIIYNAEDIICLLPEQIAVVNAESFSIELCTLMEYHSRYQ